MDKESSENQMWRSCGLAENISYFLLVKYVSDVSTCWTSMTSLLLLVIFFSITVTLLKRRLQQYNFYIVDS